MMSVRQALSKTKHPHAWGPYRDALEAAPWVYVNAAGVVPMFQQQAGVVSVPASEIRMAAGLEAASACSADPKAMIAMIEAMPFRAPFPHTWFESRDPISGRTALAVALTEMPQNEKNEVPFIANFFYRSDTGLNFVGDAHWSVDLDGMFVLGSETFQMAESFDWALSTAEHMAKDAANPDPRGHALFLTTWAIFVLQLMSCRNVQLRDEPEEKLTRAERRRREREQGKSIRFKTIVIKVPGGVEEVDLNACDQSGAMPQHMVRGHYRRYTADKPLFGRVVGSFWVPAHVRGSAALGRIEKNYRLEAAGG